MPALQHMLRVVVLAALWAAGPAAADGDDKVDLDAVERLTLHRGKITTGRREDPIPQLQCVEGECTAVDIESMKCENLGRDRRGGDIKWRCTPSPSLLHTGYSLADIAVACEGYKSPTDKYVLAGSCGVLYGVVPGVATHAYTTEHGRFHDYSSGYSYNNHRKEQQWRRWVFLGLALALGYIMFIRRPRFP